MVDKESQSNRPTSGAKLPGQVFVGRQRELAELTVALDDALAGQGRLVMLAGEPGIGKTRTAQELAALAEQRGALVLWGRCYEEEGTPPYWTWVQPMRTYVQQTDPEQLIAEMGPGAAAIAEIVAEIRSKLPDLETPPALEAEAARFRLFDSITTFLQNVAQRQPLMLVLDDLHWADRSSLLLLEFVAREIGTSSMLLVGAYRDVEVSRRHPLSQTLGALVREQLFHRVQLDGLTRQEVGELIQGGVGITLPLEAAEVIHTRTDGNPFFVAEVTRQVTLEDTENPGWASTIPEGVRDAIGRRLNRLSEQCNQILTTASVVGREFEFRLLCGLIDDSTEDQLLAAMDEAVGSHLIEELPQSVGRYQFTHALIQETLAEELSTTRTVLLHARIAEALEELYGDDLEAQAAELVYHFVEAETVLGTEKLVRYSLLAGERALATYAYEDALTHFERGLVARNIPLSGTESAPDDDSAALLFGLARAQSATGVGHQLWEAFATLSRAFEYYAEVENVALAVAAAEFPMANPERIPGVSQLMARALSLVPADSHEAGRLLSRYGAILGFAEGDYEGAQRALGRAIDIARRVGDVPLEVQTLSSAAAVSGIHLRWQESVENGLRAMELATGNENAYSEGHRCYWTVLSFLRMGNLDRARPHALVLRDLAERRGMPRQFASSNLQPITYLSCLEGDWKAGREYTDLGLELSPLSPMLLLPRILLEHETGDSAQGEVYLERLLEAMRGTGPYKPLASYRAPLTIAAIARITGVSGRLEIAEAAAEAVLSEQSVRPFVAMYARAGLALLAVQNGDRSAASEHYAGLHMQRGTMIEAVSSVDRLLGLLSQTMGNLDQAVGHFQDALAFCRKAGYLPELAWSCCDHADALWERKGPEDRAKAVFLLDEALSVSTELGMRPLMERVAERLELIRAEPSAAPAYPDGLTQREVEVLSRVAAGKSNADIAEELVISPNTVIRHVSNILAKTGSSNRTEAARYAAQNGLAE